MAARCHTGVDEEASRWEGNDTNEYSSPVTPEMRAIDGINPRDEAFDNALGGGVTTAITGPGSANVLGGSFVAMKLYGDCVDDMIVKYPVAMKIAFGENPKGCYGQNGKKEPVTRMAVAALLREQLIKAKRYAEEIEEAEKDPSKKRPFDMQLEALLPVIRKEIPLKAHAHRADDILTAIRIAKECDLDITLDHVTEALESRDKGLVEGDEIYIIRTSEVPVALIEVGFMTNQEELNLLNSTDYQKKAAEGVYDAVLDAFAKGY